jgi:hypothetical protein
VTVAAEPGILTPIEVGRWDFEAASPCYDPSVPGYCEAPDSAAWGRRLRLTQGTDIGQGTNGNFAMFDDQLDGVPTHEYGVSQRNIAAGGAPVQWQDTAVLRTDQSFTVSASVHVDSLTTTMTAIAPKGSKQSAFYLGSRLSTVGSVSAQRFEVMVPTVDQDLGEAYTHVIAPAPIDLDDAGFWTQLTVVYDAGSSKLTLYVNGVYAKDLVVPRLWNAGGPLVVGSSWWAADNTSGAWTDNWFGAVDDVSVFQGAMNATQVAKLIDGQTSP